jgi:hypothetical protein
MSGNSFTLFALTTFPVSVSISAEAVMHDRSYAFERSVDSPKRKSACTTDAAQLQSQGHMRDIFMMQ